MDTNFDVLIIGAGLSGIGAAYHLQRYCPGRTFALLEGREDLGGTWDLFRYPGVRSDSDMHTLGFGFKPWKADKAIADGPSILEYLNETVDEFRLRERIHFGTRVQRAAWLSDSASWQLQTRSNRGGATTYTCSFMLVCAGYYSYAAGYTPSFPGMDIYEGTLVHPQQWPTDLDYAGKNVVVIGSGATAMTVVPAMARTAAHVTMVQRSPTYVVSRPDTDVINFRLRKVLPEWLAYALTRKKNVIFTAKVYQLSRKDPDRIRKLLLAGVRRALGADFDVDTHFTPTYNPWDQRLCLIPNGDLFDVLNEGKASVVTDAVDAFTPSGPRLASGDILEADIVVTATGLKMVTLGDIAFEVDGEPVDFAKAWTYKGLAYSDVPNLVSVFGYINASWTLRSDLISSYVCRLLNHMKKTGTAQCTPRLRASDVDMPRRPYVANFSSGYMQRGLHLLPSQGDREPWLNTQNYARDRKSLGKALLADGVMQFSNSAALAKES
jgi:monooxygenase